TDFPIHLGDRIFLNDIIQATNANLISLVQSDLHQTRSLGKSQIKTYQVDQAEINLLLEVIHPPISLLIFGAGHDAIPLVEQAKWLGWTVTLCDHRPGYTNRDRFPGADHIIFCEPEQVAQYQLALTPQTAAVVMTHAYLRDQFLLKTLLPSVVPYIGLLGPKRRSQQILQELQQSGLFFTNQQLQRLHSPIGLDLGAETPQEIALAIVAEIQAVFAQRSGGWLRDRSAPIHTTDRGLMI
ncbi:MAG: XdhC family protein, partial [Synechococcales bacterium]|nr:XdhC family protein [Synechococcales bacterium]